MQREMFDNTINFFDNATQYFGNTWQDLDNTRYNLIAPGRQVRRNFCRGGGKTIKGGINALISRIILFCCGKQTLFTKKITV